MLWEVTSLVGSLCSTAQTVLEVIAANQIFTTAVNSSNNKQFLLPACNVSEPGFYSGSEMLGQQPEDLLRPTNCVFSL